MRETLRILVHMGQLQRAFPLWVIAMGVLAVFPSGWLLLAVLYGYVLEIVLEYVMHRFVYHRAPPTEQSPFNELYRSHIGHHEFPTDPEFFTGDDHWFIVRFGGMIAVVHTVVLWPFVGLSDAALWSFVAVFGGSALSFAFYEYCHTLAHLNVPKGWFGEKITRSHLAHHYQDHHATFHVSFGAGWLDRLFGTQHDRALARERFDRRTMLSLGMDPEDLRLVTARKAYGLPKTPGTPREKPAP